MNHCEIFCVDVEPTAILLLSQQLERLRIATPARHFLRQGRHEKFLRSNPSSFLSEILWLEVEVCNVQSRQNHRERVRQRNESSERAGTHSVFLSGFKPSITESGLQQPRRAPDLQPQVRRRLL
jgi:hypothetical protein